MLLRDIHERGKNINVNRVWKKQIPTFKDDFEGFKTSVKEITADVVEIARELGWKVEPKDVTKLLKFHEELMDEKVVSTE